MGDARATVAVDETTTVIVDVVMRLLGDEDEAKLVLEASPPPMPTVSLPSDGTL